MFVSRRCFMAVVCIVVLNFQASCMQEAQASRRVASWIYYANKSGAHVLGALAMLYAGASDFKKGHEDQKAKRNLAVALGMSCHSYGFITTFFSRGNQESVPLKKAFWPRFGLSAAAGFTHMLASYLMFSAGRFFESGREAWRGFGFGPDCRTRFIKTFVFGIGGIVMHGLGWVANERGAQLLNEFRGMKIAVKMRGFGKKNGQGKDTLKNEMKQKEGKFLDIDGGISSQ